MKKTKLTYMLIFIFSILAFSCSTCSDNKVPSIYKQGVERLKSELEKLDKIQMEEKVLISDKEHGVTGIINHSKKAEYISKNKAAWDKIFSAFEKSITSGKLNRWQDDALFCKAFGLLKIASLENSLLYTDRAISSMTHFIEFSQHSEIEEWTKRQLKTVFWDKISSLFSRNVSEKRNLDAFFHIGIASLLEHRKGNIKGALDEYEKVFNIDPHSFFAQQARAQIELLRGKRM